VEVKLWKEIMKNIHVLPTDKPSRLYKNLLTDKLFILENSFMDVSECNREYQNINITSDNEDINENDYVITKDGRLFQVSYLLSKKIENASKVVLTTEKDLIKDGVQSIPDEFLEWFVKNPSCEEVKTKLVEFEVDMGLGDECIEHGNYYKIIIPKEEPKKYKCTECHWLGVFNEMKNEQDIDYDQYCCPKCNNVIYDCRFDKWYLEEEPKQETTVTDDLKDILAHLTKMNDRHKVQETLEEAAERLYPGVDRQVDRMLFINGAKWQAERMYSEEDMKLAFETGRNFQLTGENNFNELIEQFKKKQ
jgi:hypothetical protein